MSRRTVYGLPETENLRRVRASAGGSERTRRPNYTIGTIGRPVSAKVACHQPHRRLESGVMDRRWLRSTFLGLDHAFCWTVLQRYA
jgi:hypothetical protein